MTDVQPLAEVKARLSTYVDRVEHEHDRVTITRNGRPVAVLVSPDDLESLEETLAALSDPETMAAIASLDEDIAAGRYVTDEELRKQYGL
jgi:antitoxin YefM